MQRIGIDLWHLNASTPYGAFVIEALKELEKIDHENRYIIYSTDLIPFSNNNFQCVINEKQTWLIADLQFMKKLKKAETNLVIFFDHSRKIWYKKRHFTFLESLQEVSYPTLHTNSNIQKHIFFYFLKKYIKDSEKILCFDAKTKEEMNESFDKKEENIGVIPGFFKKEIIHDYTHTGNDVHLSDSLDVDFIIYEGGTGNNKNLEKLIKAIAYIQSQWSHLLLYIIGEELVKDLALREYIIANNAMNMVNFLGELEPQKKAHYYIKSQWVILPSLYESFPFSLTNALYYNKKIITSNIKALTDIFWTSVEYFNPLSINQLSEKLIGLKNQPEPDYFQILEKYSARKSADRLLHEIEN